MITDSFQNFILNTIDNLIKLANMKNEVENLVLKQDESEEKEVNLNNF